MTAISDESSASLKAEIEQLRDEIRLRRKYGNTATSEQIAAYAKQEKIAAAKAERKKADQERAAIERVKREQEIKSAAGDLVATGRIIVSVDGVRASSVDGEGRAACPGCGAALVESAEPIIAFTDKWVTTPKDQRYGSYSPLLLQSKGSGHYIPTPFWTDGIRCRNCGKQSLTMVQLVVI